MTSSGGRKDGMSLCRGLASLLLAQALVAAGLLLAHQPAGVPPALRAKAVAVIGGILAAAACGSWWLSHTTHRQSATRPAAAVAGGLAASLIRLAVPLTLLGWLQTDRAGELVSAPLQRFMTETLVTSYLVLLLVDILLHIAGRREHLPEVPSRGND
jgi:hypothetical protein